MNKLAKSASGSDDDDADMDAGDESSDDSAVIKAR